MLYFFQMNELPARKVSLRDLFWSTPLEVNARRAIFHQREQLEASGCIDNFRIAAGLSAAVYTQTTDVEIEVNGYVTYDREVEKMDFARVHQGLWRSDSID